MRAAYSLVELLVALAIIAVLLALLLPAIQSVRLAASRMNCSSQLKQQSLATHLYHDVNQRFPSGVLRQATLGQRQTGWQTYLLPFLERDDIWQLSLFAFSNAQAFTTPPSPIGKVITLYGCPVDYRTRQSHVYETVEVALTSYLGVSGSNLNDQRGIFFADSKTRISDITDGTSNTLLIGERPPSPNFEFGWWYGGVGQRLTGSLDTVLGVAELNSGRRGLTIPRCPPGPYMFVTGSQRSMCDVFHFWSLHPNGANFAFADGSVRFLAYSANDIMPALATRAGGEVVTIPE